MNDPDLSALAWTLVGVVYFISATVAALHALVKKLEPQSALAWVGLIFLSPFVGTVLYLLFGINRIKRRAIKLRGRRAHAITTGVAGPPPIIPTQPTPLMNFADRVCKNALIPGNCVKPWINGDEAYPAMLDAIERATQTIALATYIFDNDKVGKHFCTSLQAAHSRGVAVRVLVDGVGSLYSVPPVSRQLRRAGVPFATFLPTFPPWHLSVSNMRYHRKLMIVDGTVAFTGGMNIRAGHRLHAAPKHPIRDWHFQVTGPIVSELQEVFINDWHFASGELLDAGRWLPPLEPQGDGLIRVIPDGPDENYGKIRWMLLGAIAEAQHTVRIMTPYFTPDTALIAALNTAALRGIKVSIVLPSTNNLPWMHWAMQALIGQLLQKGCRVFWSAPPFEHTKLMSIDDNWSFFGSANWDSRSLRLNFELNLECYETKLARSINAYIDHRIGSAREVTYNETRHQHLALRIRNGFVRLFLPVL